MAFLAHHPDTAFAPTVVEPLVDIVLESDEAGPPCQGLLASRAFWLGGLLSGLAWLALAQLVLRWG